jgi:hypothetical protein
MMFFKSERLGFKDKMHFQTILKEEKSSLKSLPSFLRFSYWDNRWTQALDRGQTPGLSRSVIQTSSVSAPLRMTESVGSGEPQHQLQRLNLCKRNSHQGRTQPPWLLQWLPKAFHTISSQHLADIVAWAPNIPNSLKATSWTLLMHKHIRFRVFCPDTNYSLNT